MQHNYVINTYLIVINQHNLYVCDNLIYSAMHLKNPKKLILSLLLDDLIHAKLLDGLAALNLQPGDYSIDLADKVIMLMGFRGKQNILVYEYYLNRRAHAGAINTSNGNAEMKEFAALIYKELLQFKLRP